MAAHPPRVQTQGDGGVHQFLVVASSLHVRSGPSITFAPLGGLRKGDVVDLIDTSGDGYWFRIKKGTLQGWCSQKYLQSVQHGVGDQQVEGGEFPWMPIALAEVGVKAFPGSADNARIVEYLRSTNLGAPYNANDETAWCSGFVNWCLERSGLEGTDSAWALSWSNWGKEVREPRRGSIAVFTRPGGGHVGFVMSRTAQNVELLGGNQSEAVTIERRSTKALVGFREPI